MSEQFKYHKIQNISPGLINIRKHFSKSFLLFLVVAEYKGACRDANGGYPGYKHIGYNYKKEDCLKECIRPKAESANKGSQAEKYICFYNQMAQCFW